ncbi:polysaccharide deacetylase family protein [Propionicicella superfundia]|uniref:polysaccharide deacetylase family protein n=1 Tax=Propionicicella superfundia TaxID=348582 RepID=UPI00040E8A8F|nr:polysaccharide deacetylase family protein [Propionicicella superfundia]
MPRPVAVYPAFRRGLERLGPRARRVLDAATSPFGSILRAERAGRRIALTFDDGPDPDVTPRLLAGLADAGAQATFFLLLSRVRRFPRVAAAVADGGHEIALHGLDHRRLTTLPLAEARRSITFARAELSERLGTEVRWFRPPYGAQTVQVWQHVRREGMETVLWGPGLADTEQVAVAERRRRRRARPGDIVLGHDGVADRDDGVDDPPPPALDRVAWALDAVREYQDGGLTVGTVGALLDAGTAVKGARFTR